MLRLRSMKFSGATLRVALGVLGILAALGVPAGVSYAACNTVVPLGCEGQWRVAGQNLANTRYQATEQKISPTNVSGLQIQWVFTTDNDVSATPTVFGSDLYVPDWAGNLFSIDQRTGRANWSRKISDYSGVPGSMSRNSPAVEGNALIIGTWPPGGQARSGTWPNGEGAQVIAVNRQTGALLWKTTVDSFISSQITGSPIVFRNVVYVGVSSGEEGLAEDPKYACCVFRGSVVALDAHTGRILWKTYMVPDNGGRPGGYSGGAVWSPPAVDVRRNSLMVATGNNYSIPPDVEACQQRQPPQGGCIPPGTPNYFDAVVALDLQTGAVKWATGVEEFDTWTRACFNQPSPNCPVPASPDYDFAGGVSLFMDVQGTGPPRDVIGAGQKSGIYWAFDPNDGHILWGTQVGPGGTLGGIEWGTAAGGDEGRIYVAIANNFNKPYTLKPSGQQVTAGSWSALDAVTGEIIWQTADPTGGIDPGPVSVANGVVYAASMDKAGYMYALDAATGAVLWSFASGGSVNSAPAVVNGVVYWGSGYRRRGLGSGNNKLYAFSLPGH
jgi:polyvinyl alcohol dehydrogenase (cytochrome)